MIARVILVVVFLVSAVASAYMSWLTWRAGDESKWLFTVFLGFFLLLAATPILPKPKPKSEPPITSTRFVPHWFMMLAVLVLLLLIIMAIVGAIMRR